MNAHSATVNEAGAPPQPHHMDPTTAYHAAKLGMWLFLATEILLFAALFVAFALYHWAYFDQFHHASTHLKWKFGVFNTVILLVSSYTAAVGVYAAQMGDNKRIIRNFGFSVAAGAVFLLVKAYEYHSKYTEGYFPGTTLWNSPDFSDDYRNYFGIYYCLTGLHALHVIIGMSFMAWVMTKARKNRFSERYYTPVELAALYWHLVDLIWIFLFPLLYLVG